MRLQKCIIIENDSFLNDSPSKKMNGVKNLSGLPKENVTMDKRLQFFLLNFYVDWAIVQISL